jgi:branched-chain amino acid transport system ATP-binding protein
MLELRELTGGWGPTTIVENVSLSVAPGETVAVIGRNGVGKSTLLELIANRAHLSSGSVLLDDRDVSGLATHRRARLGVGYVPQAREVFSSLSVAEHIDISERPGRWTRSTVLDLFPSLAARLSSRGGQLSGGEQQMLAIARALLGNPRVLLMDEPSEGLAPVVVEHLVHAIRAVAAERSMAILLVEQRIDVALDLADRYVIMDRGRVVAEGMTDDLRERQDELPAMMGLVRLS